MAAAILDQRYTAADKYHNSWAYSLSLRAANIVRGIKISHAIKMYS